MDYWHNADVRLFPGTEEDRDEGGFLLHAVSFPPASKNGTPPGINVGDKLLYYAVGRGFFFATRQSGQAASPRLGRAAAVLG